MEYERKFLYEVEWKIFSMKWKKIAGIEYGEIVFHTMPVLPYATNVLP